MFTPEHFTAVCPAIIVSRTELPALTIGKMKAQS